jgi:hypothetical protein
MYSVRLRLWEAWGPLNWMSKKRLSYYLPLSLCHPPILIRFASLESKQIFSVSGGRPLLVGDLGPGSPCPPPKSGPDYVLKAAAEK